MGLRGFRYSPLGLRDGMLAQMLAEGRSTNVSAPEDRERAVGRRARGLREVWD